MSILWFVSWWYELSNFFVVSISTSRTPRFTIKVVEFYNGLLMPLHGIYKYPCFVLVLLLESIYVLNNEQMVEIPWNLKWNCVWVVESAHCLKYIGGLEASQSKLLSKKIRLKHPWFVINMSLKILEIMSLSISHKAHMFANSKEYNRGISLE